LANVYMEEFKKRLTKGLIGGGLLALFMVLSPIIMGESVFASVPWYLVPVLLIVTVLYGTGWAFAYNLLKRCLRIFVRTTEDATIWQMFASNGFLMGFVYALVFLIIGCFVSFILGNIFMVIDFLRAKQGKAPVSVKYTFDGDKNIDRSERIKSVIENASGYNDAASGASYERREENQRNLEKIRNGESGTLHATVGNEEREININQV